MSDSVHCDSSAGNAVENYTIIIVMVAVEVQVVDDWWFNIIVLEEGNFARMQWHSFLHHGRIGFWKASLIGTTAARAMERIGRDLG